jgi:hypothetical protein
MPTHLKRVLLLVDRAGPHYLCLILAGISGLLWTNPTILKTAYLTVTLYFLLASLIVGGLCCVVGRWLTATVPKMVGLGLNIVAILSYITAALGAWPNSAASIFLLLSFTSMLVYRFLHVRRCHDALAAVRRGRRTGRTRRKRRLRRTRRSRRLPRNRRLAIPFSGSSSTISTPD